MSSGESIDYNSIYSPDFAAGYADAWEAFQPGEPVGDPVSSDNYRFGWYCGIGDAKAWDKGYQAYKNGLWVCPYVMGSDDECFRQPWLDGYWVATA